jgi:hypothetical protein
MTQFDAEFDYLLLLGVEPADAAKSLAALAAQVKALKKEWTSQALNPLYQQAARSNLERAREFEELLKEPAALAAYLNHVHQVRMARRDEHEATAFRLLTTAAAGRKDITPLQRELIAKELKAHNVPAGILDEVIKLSGLKVSVGTEKPQAEKLELPTRSPVLDGVIQNEIQNWLKVLGKGSLYELLDLPDTTSPQRLVSTAQTLFLYWSKKLPKINQTTAWEKSLQSAITYLKDPETKARYDRGLFNQRIQKFVRRIDLVLAGSVFNPDTQAHLTRAGVEEFGFVDAVIDQCIAARMAEKGISPASRASVTIQFHGQIRCRRCGIWNAPKSVRCRECGGALHRKCENPACRGGPLPADTKVCPTCSLPVARGTQYRTLLRLADAFLDSGSHAAAISVCQIAEQILPGEALSERLDRSVKIRDLAASALNYAASNAWNAVRSDLKQLNTLAPLQKISNVPSLEKVAAYQASWLEKLRPIVPETEPVEAAKVYLGCLRQWSDCDEAYQKLRLLCKRLEMDRRPRMAWQIATRLLEIRPGEADLRLYVEQLEPEMKRVAALEDERRTNLKEYVLALREHRLYAAERALQEIEQSPVDGPAPPNALELRRKLSEVRAELGAIRDSAIAQSQRDQTIARYLELLRCCRDCREALVSLQSASLDPPEPPEGLNIRLEGNRRMLSWKPPGLGKHPTVYVVQRSLTRPGSRQVDPPFVTIFEGDSLHVNDDEIAHCGTILRYTVQGVVRGRIELEGSIIRTYDIASQPAIFSSVLIWQEVMNLRCTRRERSLELTWHQPSGARQVLIERWLGGPEDHCLGFAILPSTAEGRLLDAHLAEGIVLTYRVSCLYDGPEGEFRTPGVCLTDGIVSDVPTANNVSPHLQTKNTLSSKT